MSGKSIDSFSEDNDNDQFPERLSVSPPPAVKPLSKFNLARSTTKNELFSNNEDVKDTHDDDGDCHLEGFYMMDQINEAATVSMNNDSKAAVKAVKNRTASIDGPVDEGGATATFNIGTFNNRSYSNAHRLPSFTFSVFSADLLAVQSEEYEDFECYPEQINELLAFLGRHRENGASAAEVSSLEHLTVELLSVIPRGESVLEKILQRHGWNSKTLKYESGVTGRRHLNQATVASLHQDLGTLHVTHANRRTAAAPVETSPMAKTIPSNSVLMQDSYVYKSYLPDILFIHLYQKTLDDPAPDHECTTVDNTSDKGEMSVSLSGFRHTDNISNLYGAELGAKPVAATLSVYCSKFTGACLIVDISGFMRLSCSFCSQGKAGLDKLYQNANSLLVRFVDIVYSFQGDVISFAGDALICVFPSTSALSAKAPDDQGEMRKTCSRALACANVLKSTKAEGLTSHIAVSCGMFRFATLGGYKNQWVYVVNGECLADISVCVEEAGPGEVVITKEVYEYISSSSKSKLVVANVGAGGNFKVLDFSTAGPVEGSRDDNRYNGLPITAEVEVLGALFVPKPVQDAVNAGTFRLMAELRDVTTMFLKLDSYDVLFHRNPLTLQDFFFMAQKAIADNGGYVRQFLIDDKGCVLIALWGVRSFSHVNNHDRAVSAAISIHNSAPRMGHKTSIGIASGNVFCGNVGSLERRDFVAIGDKVNLAARLMGKAQGSIFVENLTCTSCSVELRQQMISVGSMNLKGVNGSTFVFKCMPQSKPLGVHNDASARTHFIRKSIVEVVTTAVKRVNGGKEANSIKEMLVNSFSRNKSLKEGDSEWGPVVDASLASALVIEGAAGSGKESVVSLALASARHMKMEVTHVALKHGHKTVVLGTLRELFVAIVGEELFETMEQQQKLLRALAGLFPTEVGSYSYSIDTYFNLLAVALGLPWVEYLEYNSCRLKKNQSPDNLLDKAGSEISLEMVLSKALQLLMSTQPRVIVIDDMQYADESSWKGIYALLHTDLRCLVVMTLLVSGSALVRSPSKQSKKAFFGNVGSKSSESMTAEEMGKRSGFPAIYQIMVLNNRFKRIFLAPLTTKETEKYVCQVLKCSEVSPVIIDALMRLSSGNMYWLKEATLYMAEQGEEAFLSTLDGNSSPLTVLIVCRLEKISFAAQAVLKYASVIGDEFEYAVLSHSVPSQFLHNLSASLDTLIQYGFISVVNEDPLMFKFLNQMIRSEVYQLIPVSESALIHTVVADQILACNGPSLESLHSVLSYHYAFGVGSRALAFKHAVKAVESAIEREGFLEALVHARNALYIACSPTELTVLTLAVTEASRFFHDMNLLPPASNGGGVVTFLFGFSGGEAQFSEDYSEVSMAYDKFMLRVAARSKEFSSVSIRSSSLSEVAARVSASIPEGDREYWDPALLASCAGGLVSDLLSARVSMNGPKDNGTINSQSSQKTDLSAAASPRFGILSAVSERIAPVDAYIVHQEPDVHKSSSTANVGVGIVSPSGFFCCR